MDIYFFKQTMSTIHTIVLVFLVYMFCKRKIFTECHSICIKWYDDSENSFSLSHIKRVAFCRSIFCLLVLWFRPHIWLYNSTNVKWCANSTLRLMMVVCFFPPTRRRPSILFISTHPLGCMSLVHFQCTLSFIATNKQTHKTSFFLNKHTKSGM